MSWNKDWGSSLRNLKERRHKCVLYCTTTWNTSLFWNFSLENICRLHGAKAQWHGIQIFMWTIQVQTTILVNINSVLLYYLLEEIRYGKTTYHSKEIYKYHNLYFLKHTWDQKRKTICGLLKRHIRRTLKINNANYVHTKLKRDYFIRLATHDKAKCSTRKKRLSYIHVEDVDFRN